MVMTYMAGVRLNDIDALDKLGVDKQVLVDSITRAYAHQIYVDGFFNADPHPGQHLSVYLYLLAFISLYTKYNYVFLCIDFL